MQYSIVAFESSTGYHSETPGELGFRQPRTEAESLASMFQLMDKIDQTLVVDKGHK